MQLTHVLNVHVILAERRSTQRNQDPLRLHPSIQHENCCCHQTCQNIMHAHTDTVDT